MISNRDIAAALDGVAGLLEIDDASPFRVRAYRNAADSIRFFDPPIAEMVANGDDLTTLEDVGAGLAKAIAAIVTDGPEAYFASSSEPGSAGLLELLRIPGLGPKKVRALRDDAGVRSLDDLRAALDDGRLEGISGFGGKTLERLRARLDKADAGGS